MDWKLAAIIVAAVLIGIAIGRGRSAGNGGRPAAPRLPVRPRVPAGEAGPHQVRLIDAGPNKISVIKEVREATGLGLKESKDLVDAAPSIVARGLSRAAAEQLAQALRDSGGAAEVA